MLLLTAQLQPMFLVNFCVFIYMYTHQNFEMQIHVCRLVADYLLHDVSKNRTALYHSALVHE